MVIINKIQLSRLSLFLAFAIFWHNLPGQQPGKPVLKKSRVVKAHSVAMGIRALPETEAWEVPPPLSYKNDFLAPARPPIGTDFWSDAMTIRSGVMWQCLINVEQPNGGLKRLAVALATPGWPESRCLQSLIIIDATDPYQPKHLITWPRHPVMELNQDENEILKVTKAMVDYQNGHLLVRVCAIPRRNDGKEFGTSPRVEWMALSLGALPTMKVVARVGGLNGGCSMVKDGKLLVLDNQEKTVKRVEMVPRSADYAKRSRRSTPKIEISKPVIEMLDKGNPYVANPSQFEKEARKLDWAAGYAVVSYAIPAQLASGCNGEDLQLKAITINQGVERFLLDRDQITYRKWDTRSGKPVVTDVPILSNRPTTLQFFFTGNSVGIDGTATVKITGMNPITINNVMVYPNDADLSQMRGASLYVAPEFVSPSAKIEYIILQLGSARAEWSLSLSAKSFLVFNLYLIPLRWRTSMSDTWKDIPSWNTTATLQPIADRMQKSLFAGLPVSGVNVMPMGSWLTSSNSNGLPVLEIDFQKERQIYIDRGRAIPEYYVYWNELRYKFFWRYFMDKQQKLWKKLRTAGFFFIPLIASPGIGAGSGISSGLIDQHLLSDFINIQTGTSSDETVIWHEIGHLGGLKHPPGTIGWGEPPDSNWPRASDYSNGRIGVWGWDSRASSQYPNGRLINPMTGDLMGGRNPRWISDYDVAVWFQNMKMAPSPVIQSQTTVRIKEQLKSKFIFEGTDLAYFDKRLSILNGVVKSNSDVGYWLNSSTSSVGDTLGLRNPNGRIEVINRQGAVLSFPCMIESLSEDTRLKCDFIADIPVRTGFTKYKVYFNKDDPSPVAVGTVPTPPSDPVVKMNIIDDKRFEIEVDRTQDDLTDVFYTLDAGATWAELSTMHDGKDTTDFDTSMKGKDLRVLAVCYHGSKRVAYLYLAQQGIVKKVEGF